MLSSTRSFDNRLRSDEIKEESLEKTRSLGASEAGIASIRRASLDILGYAAADTAKIFFFEIPNSLY